MATLQELEARQDELIKRRESLITRARTGDKGGRTQTNGADGQQGIGGPGGNLARATGAVWVGLSSPNHSWAPGKGASTQDDQRPTGRGGYGGGNPTDNNGSQCGAGGAGSWSAGVTASHITNMLLESAQKWPPFLSFSLRFAKSDRLLALVHQCGSRCG